MRTRSFRFSIVCCCPVFSSAVLPKRPLAYFLTAFSTTSTMAFTGSASVITGKSCPGQSNAYYNASKPTVIYIHGWQNGPPTKKS